MFFIFFLRKTAFIAVYLNRRHLKKPIENQHRLPPLKGDEPTTGNYTSTSLARHLAS
jgi:hypothetical protein